MLENQRKILILLIAISSAVVLVLTVLFITAHTAYALPEYADRTDETCATCHVSPGGGGPRTMRGLLWAAKGKPDAVPDLPGVLIAPGVNDSEELYRISCSSCHGVNGEGIFGRKLLFSGVSEKKIQSNILRGRLQSGMPSFDGKFTIDQLDALVAFVTRLANGEVTPQPEFFPLDPAQFEGIPTGMSVPTGGN